MENISQKTSDIITNFYKVKHNHKFLYLQSDHFKLIGFLLPNVFYNPKTDLGTITILGSKRLTTKNLGFRGSIFNFSPRYVSLDKLSRFLIDNDGLLGKTFFLDIPKLSNKIKIK